VKAFDDAIGLAREAFQKRGGQRHDIVTPFAQGRQVHGDGADAVIQILAQFAVLDGFLGLRLVAATRRQLVW
jgi:hypothetical protein